MARAMINVSTNIDKLAEDIGTYIGIAQGIEERAYMDSLLTTAHEKSVPAFVKAAAGSAKELNFTHMYEYGVAGITRGDKQFINPMARSARLWTDLMVGRGSRRLITFAYRPATKRVPRHTTEETGVAQEELDKLKINQGKRYVFYNKAEVFEQGIDVSIWPKKKGGMLFVPLNGAESMKANAKDKARGFTWAKHIKTNPGQNTDSVGAFSFFFFDWWETDGGNLMSANMQKSVTKHIEMTEAKIGTNVGRMKSPRNTHVLASGKSASARTKKQFTIFARREEGTKQVIF